MNYWQVAAGDGKREYSDVFLKYGVMIIGPGDPGEYFENKDFYSDNKNISQSDVTAIRSFAEEVEIGDIIVLKRPAGQIWEDSRARVTVDKEEGKIIYAGLKWEIVAIGTVESKYKHLEVFEDVEGWDLQHARDIKWYIPIENDKIINGLARGTFKGINKLEVKNNLILIKERSEYIEPNNLPKPPKKLTDEDLIDKLIENGLRPKNAEEFTLTINRIRRLVNWYNYHGKDVNERETLTFLIIPLLQVLGWPEQKLKIDWQKIDIAFFEEPYNNVNYESNKCIAILESKRLLRGLAYVKEQAEKYAESHPECDKLIVSDGCRYKVYKKIGGEWIDHAYFNILKPKITHPFNPKIGGAYEVFSSLMHK